MTEPVEWERLADHEEGVPAPRPSLCDYCGMDRRVHDSRTWMAHCEATAAAHPDALKQMRAERDAARRELAEVREQIGAPTPAGYEYRANGPLIHKITEDDVSRYPDEWVDDYLPERRPLYAGAWERLDGGEWKAADDA